MGRNKVRVPRARLTCHRVIFVSTLIAISVVLSDCAKQPKPVVGTGEIAPSISKATYDAYQQGGWVPLVEPDSRFVPGTIFETKENTAPRWISSLETCGFPKTLLREALKRGDLISEMGEKELEAMLTKHLERWWSVHVTHCKSKTHLLRYIGRYVRDRL